MDAPSECRKLISQVRMLCDILKRPISSKDLLIWYRKHPEQQPLLMQRIGQQLIKAAHRKGACADTICRIGLHGNLAYYAPETEQQWTEAFLLFIVQERAKSVLRLALPQQASVLIGTEYEKLARNALRGFFQEWSPMLALLAESKWKHCSDFTRLLSIADRLGSKEFVPVSGELCNRSEARLFLLAESNKRRHDFRPDVSNTNRHLVRLKWPQSNYFKKHTGFSKLQISHYCAEKWPVTMEEVEFSGAIFRCLGYGIYGLDPSSTSFSSKATCSYGRVTSPPLDPI